MKTKCVLATNSKEDLQKMINQYFYSENYIITEATEYTTVRQRNILTTLSFRRRNQDGVLDA